MPSRIALVAHVKDGSNSSPSSAVDTTGATLLVNIISGGSSPITTTDSKSNTWHDLTLWDDPGFNRNAMQLSYAFNATVGTGHTFTPNSANCSHVAAAFSGIKASADPFFKEVGGFTPVAGGDDSARTGLIIPPNNTGEILVVSAFSIDDPAGNTLITCEGFTIIDVFDVVPGSIYGVALAYKILNRGGIGIEGVWRRPTKNTQAGDQFNEAVFLGVIDPTRGRFPPQQRV